MDDPIENILAENIDLLQKPLAREADHSGNLPAADGEVQSYLDLVKEISRVSSITPRSEFVSGASGRLVRKLKPRKVQNPAPAWWSALFSPRIWQVSRSPVLVAALALILLVFVSTGTVYASSNALPGDFLYPVKLGIENAQVSLSSNETGAQLDLKFASMRLDEAAKLAQMGRYNLVAETVLAGQAKIAEAKEKSNHLSTGQDNTAKLLMEQAASQQDQNQTVLSQILEKVPPTARDGILNAIRNSGKKPGQQKNQIEQGSSMLSGKQSTATDGVPALLEDTWTPPGFTGDRPGGSPEGSQSSSGSPPGQQRKSLEPVDPLVNPLTALPSPESIDSPELQRTKTP